MTKKMAEKKLQKKSQKKSQKNDQKIRKNFSASMFIGMENLTCAFMLSTSADFSARVSSNSASFRVNKLMVSCLASILLSVKKQKNLL